MWHALALAHFLFVAARRGKPCACRRLRPARAAGHNLVRAWCIMRHVVVAGKLSHSGALSTVPEPVRGKHAKA